MKNEKLEVVLLGEHITISGVSISDEPDGSGIISLDWHCESDVDVESMNIEVEKFITEVLQDMVGKDLSN